MARIYPFRALRYDTGKVAMADVVTQPYDKITPAMQQAYYDKSRYNLIRIILGKKEPGDVEGPDGPNVYTRAAECLVSWRGKGILKPEAEPALYGYTQTYTVPGTAEVRERRGFIGLGHLYDYAEKVVYRHEQTFPKHKSDRLALFKATRAYCEQIYMLYSDPAFTAEKLIFDSGASADLSITDEYGVVHKLWRLVDPHLINLIVGAMADKKLIIADGHHRYETSVAYMKERETESGYVVENKEQPADESSSPDKADVGHGLLPVPAFPEAAMMMTFVNMEAPGITILPTHRVVFGLKLFKTEEFLTKAEEFFDVLPVLSADLEPLVVAGGVAFLAVTRDGTHLLTAKPEIVAKLLKEKEIPERQAALDVVQLHTVVLERLLGLTHDGITRGENIRYVREAADAVAQVQSNEADIAFLIRPVTLEQMKEISFAGEVMPQKSTDFYPKLLSGLAIYTLE